MREEIQHAQRADYKDEDRKRMTQEVNAAIEKQIAAHRRWEEADIARLRALSLHERGRLIEAACETAAAIYHSRLATGLPKVQRDPWPQSTWEFLRKQATRARE